MKKNFGLCVVAFFLGFWVHSAAEGSGRATGVGGVFLTSENPAALKAWYQQHLGMPMDEHGYRFEWKTNDSKRAITQWSVMAKGNQYFAPSKAPFMINYRVQDLGPMVERLKADRVQILDEIEHTPYGDFVHVLDCDGNKVELWEPPA